MSQKAQLLVGQKANKLNNKGFPIIYFMIGKLLKKNENENFNFSADYK